MAVILLFYGKKRESKDVEEVMDYCRENGIEVVDARGDSA